MRWSLWKTDRTNDLGSWLQEWEQALSEAREANISDIQGLSGLMKILTAVHGAVPDFFTHWKNKIADAYTDDPEVTPGKANPGSPT